MYLSRFKMPLLCLYCELFWNLDKNFVEMLVKMSQTLPNMRKKPCNFSAVLLSDWWKRRNQTCQKSDVIFWLLPAFMHSRHVWADKDLYKFHHKDWNLGETEAERLTRRSPLSVGLWSLDLSKRRLPGLGAGEPTTTGSTPLLETAASRIYQRLANSPFLFYCYVDINNQISQTNKGFGAMNVPDKKENPCRFSYSHRGSKTGERVLWVLRKKREKERRFLQPKELVLNHKWITAYSSSSSHGKGAPPPKDLGVLYILWAEKITYGFWRRQRTRLTEGKSVSVSLWARPPNALNSAWTAIFNL